MGRPMARRLAERYDVIAFDLDASRFDGLDSVARAKSVREVGESARTVLMSLPTTGAVEAVVLGEGGLLEAAGGGAVAAGDAAGAAGSGSPGGAASGGTGPATGGSAESDARLAADSPGAARGGTRGSSPAGNPEAPPILAAGGIIIDMSTTQPIATRRIAAALAERGVSFADAPVSGGPAGAAGGSLSIMVGCEEGDWKRAEAVLATLGSSVVRVGAPGSGGVAKLVNNMIVGAAFASVAEGFAVAAAHGIDISTLHQAIRGGWAGSKVLDLSAEAVSKGDFAPTGTVDLLSKDLGYARDLARADSIPVPVTAIVDEVFTAAKARGSGGNFQAVIIELWEKLLGRAIGAHAGERGTVTGGGRNGRSKAKE